MDREHDKYIEALAEQGYCVIDHFLPAGEVADILSVFGEAALRPAGIGKGQGRQINEAVRGDSIRWIDPAQATPPLQNYLDRLRAWINVLNRTLYVGLKDFEVHLAEYPVGAFYKRHLDQFRQDDHRKMSVICYLNANWEAADGGALRLFLPHGVEEIWPEAGRMVCFRSDQIEHEVAVAHRVRRSITGWLLNQYADLKYL